MATQGREKGASDAEFGHSAVQAVSERYAIPLEASQVDGSVLIEERNDMTDYARQYLDLVTQENNSVWWKLFNCASAKNWCNILALVELLFCLPMSNGHVERVFSQLKLIKTDRRA